MRVLTQHVARPLRPKVFFLFFTQILVVMPWNTYAEKPEVIILATGGTIAGKSSGDENVEYVAGALSIRQLLASLPELKNIAKLRGEQVSNIGSQDMNDAVWVRLAERIAILRRETPGTGIVITHGTDTLEETAFFLDLLFPSGAPIILTAAMRPSDAIGADGPLNLYHAVLAASLQATRDRGVLVIVNGKVHRARHVAKISTSNVDAFSSHDFGLEGEYIQGHPVFFSAPSRDNIPNVVKELPKVLPKVGIMMSHASVNADRATFFRNHDYAGLVLAGVGNGNTSIAVLAELRQLQQKGIAIVRASRLAHGYVSRNVEVNDSAFGFIAAHDLPAHKARILLSLLLLTTTDVSTIQKGFSCETPLVGDSCKVGY